jgi:hypothetical protein
MPFKIRSILFEGNFRGRPVVVRPEDMPDVVRAGLHCQEVRGRKTWTQNFKREAIQARASWGLEGRGNERHDG